MANNYDDNEELSKLVSDESVVSKFVKAGIMALAVSKVAKSGANKSIGKLLSSDVAKYTTITAGTMMLSSDDDRGGDIAVASSLIAGMAGIKHVKSLTNTAEGMAKVQKKLRNADEMFNNASLKVFNFNDKIKETFSAKFSEKIKTRIDALEKSGVEESTFQTARGMVFDIGKSIFETAVAPLDNLKKFGLIKGMKENIKNIDNTQTMRMYNSMGEVERSQLKEASNMTMGFNKTKVYNDESGRVRSALETISSKLGHSGLFDKDGAIKEANIEQLKKINKINAIKSNTTFSDMGGMYTQYDEATGMMKLNISRLGSEESSNVDIINKLYGNFEKDMKKKFGSTVVKDVNGKALKNADGDTIFENEFNKLTSGQKEEAFVSYLNDNGFGDFVKNNYKVENAVTYGDINEMFEDKTLGSIKRFEDLQYKLKEMKRKGDISTDMFDKRMAQIDERMKIDKYADTDIINAVHNSLDNKNLQKFVDVDKSNLFSKGVKNADVLKNFTFTNVVTKSAEFGYADKTALDGTIVGLKALGIIEKSFVGNFKIPFARSFNTWNPLKLLETDGRIKEKVANDMSKYGVSSNGFILDGKAVQHQSYTLPGLKGEPDSYHSEYFSNGSNNYKRIFRKQKIDIIDDNYEVAKENVKENTTYRELWGTIRKDGVKSALEKASNSQLNPYGFRYVKGKGFRVVNPEESYYNEAPILSGVFNGNTGDNGVLSYMDKKGKTDGILRRTANLILGESGDINGRDLDINNKFIISRRDSAEEGLITQLIRQAELQSNIMKNDPKHKAKILQEYGGNANLYLANENLMYRLAGQMYEKEGSKLAGILKKKAAGDADIENILYQMIKDDGVEGSRRAVIGAAVTKLDKNNKAHAKFLDFIEGNQEVFDNYRALNDFDLSKNFNFNLKTAGVDVNVDNSIIAKQIKKNFDTLKDVQKFNKLEFFVNNSREFIKNNSEYSNDFNNLFRSNLAIESSASDGMKQLLRFVNKVDRAKESALESVGKEIGKNQLITDTVSMDFIKDQIRNNIDGVGDEIKNVYNLNLGYEFNHLLKNDKDVQASVTVLDALSEAIKPLNKPMGDLDILKPGLINGDKSYAKGNIDTFVNRFKKEQTNDLNKDFKVYDFFDDLNESTGVEKGKKHNSYLEGVESLRNMKFVKRKEVLGASMVVEDSLKAALNVRNAMEATRQFVESFIKGNKLSFASLDARMSSNSKILSSSKNFGEMDSTFGLFMKTAINKVQAPLEMIGIERMTNKQLGSNWKSQYKNFFKYRYVPLAASVLGYMAVDSATDAIVPDEAGILGNGITGVATRTYATARVGAQYAAKYTGLLSVVKAIDQVIPVDNGLTWMLDLTMDPEEMKDVYFNGKAVRVNKNRNWYTAGRQHGEGEEFGEYRPHLLYTMGNRTAGIYDNKIEKFFRQDFALTKYPWYIIDPYKEERDAYQKFGASYPKTEQLFKDIPMLGHLLSATVGEIIKPTRYIAEEMWRAGENMMKNPGYNPNDPNSPEFIEFSEPNKLMTAFFDMVEDYKTFSGMHGYLIGKGTEAVFGKVNPYKDKVVLSSIDTDTSYAARYEDLQLGGMFGTTEGIRRLLDGESLGTINVNPLLQNLPGWMPDFYKKGQNPYMKSGFAQYIMPGEAFDDTYNATGNEEVDRFKTLSMIAPYSQPFDELKSSIQNKLGNLSKDEQTSFYESLGYAEDYKKRQYDDRQARAKDVQNTQIRIDKKISYNEFISDGKRYKIDNVESNFNELSERLGNSKARSLINKFDNQFQEGSEYSFNMSKDAQYSVGKDRDGDYIKIGAQNISSKIKGKSVYNRDSSSLFRTIAKPLRIISETAMTSDIEKVLGKKTAYNEWSQENVQSPYFRDWDNLSSSFIEPYYNFSSNSFLSSVAFSKQANSAFMNSGATFDFATALITAGRAKFAYNKISGGVTKSSAYEDDARVNRELQKIKSLNGERSYFNMSGNENLSELKSMVNENDAQFLEGLINTTNTKERANILKYADTVTSGVLQKVWNKQQELIGNGNSDKMYEIEEDSFDSVVDIGDYSGDTDQARIALKIALGVGRSKLDAKKIGMINSYRGAKGFSESEIVKEKIYKGYNTKTITTSTIYPKGTININRRD